LILVSYIIIQKSTNANILKNKEYLNPLCDILNGTGAIESM
jgi:hypothetical protein